MKTPHPFDMIARAFELADEFTFELMQAHCVPHDDLRLALGLTDEDGSEVSTLAEASSAIREAFEWLSARGYVELARDASGEYIDVRKRPGEEDE